MKEPPTCLGGHPLSKQDSAEGDLSCDKCEIVMSKASGFYHCAEECDYDLCLACAECTNGHELWKVNAAPSHYTAVFASNEVQCDVCSSII
jgi:hypothetical protein